MRVPLWALLWILLKAQMLSVGALEEEIPARHEMEHALMTVPDPRGNSCEVRLKGDSRNSQGKDPGL